MAQKWPKMAQNYPNWPKNDARIYALFPHIFLTEKAVPQTFSLLECMHPIQLVSKFRTICWQSVSGSSGRHFWKQRRTSHWQLVECNKQTKVRSPMWFCFYIVLFYLTFNDWITFSYVSLLHHGLYMMCHDPTTSNMNMTQSQML